MPDSLSESISRQREALASRLSEPLAKIAHDCVAVWQDKAELDALLQTSLDKLPFCKYLYALTTEAMQISANASAEGPIEADYGRDRSLRPYMREAVPATGFLLSEAYISKRANRPSVTAIQIVRDGDMAIGFIGADFDLRDLPLTQALYDEPTGWRQIKGDPAIRGNLFQQSRVESMMDRGIDDAMSVMEELMCDHGVFHTILHFSSSRATIWLTNDPYRYRILEIGALTDPDICLAYPRRDYPDDAIVSQQAIRPVLNSFKELRLMDETIYLRSASINIFNGTVGLTFSCDGSHYMQVEEFIGKGMDFWVGRGSTTA